ncbi:unnamed protein product, partial [marine sediment metagenome]
MSEDHPGYVVIRDTATGLTRPRFGHATVEIAKAE